MATDALGNQIPDDVSAGNEVRAMFLGDLKMPTTKHVLVWFASDPMSFLTIAKLTHELKSKETFSAVWDGVKPVGDKLAPKLDKLFMMDEQAAGGVSILMETSEDVLVRNICASAMKSIHGKREIGIQSQSGLQINPHTVGEALDFFTNVILPIATLFLRRKR